MLDERRLGGLYGLLVGDALGVPYEFRRPAQLPPLDQIELAPPRGYDRAHGTAPYAAWSDDGAMALCLLDSLLARGVLDVDDLAARFVRWAYDGYLAVDGRVFDIGIQTSQALRAIQRGAPALDPIPTEERGNGNGALMRVLPLALWHRGDDAALARDARLQTRVTHPHLRAQLCSVVYCLWARAYLEGVADPWAAAVARTRATVADEPAARDELGALRLDDPPGGKGSGYAVDSLHSARFALAAGGYEAAVKAAVSLGDDTDTTAAITGGIAGLRDGVGAIPARWRSAVTERAALAALVERWSAAVLEPPASRPAGLPLGSPREQRHERAGAERERRRQRPRQLVARALRVVALGERVPLSRARLGVVVLALRRGRARAQRER